jgi:arylsulfatase A-like enzyme
MRYVAAMIAAALIGAGGAAAAEPAKRPNIVFILADDLGWADLGCYGSTYHQTPHIDALARRGLRFTQAYAASPLCSPTRASIMTGLLPARLGITTPSCHVKEEVFEQKVPDKADPKVKILQPNSVTRLKLEYHTLAEALKEGGYRTGHFGKWHLGREPYDPLHHGFDIDFPHWYGPGPAGGYVAPWRFQEEVLKGKPGEHIEERLAGEVIRFIKDNKDRPFFVNYWCFSVHSPWGGKKDLIEHYRRTADPKSPQRNPVYAAMIHTMDESVGRVVQALDDLGLADNTLLVFFSDNGGIDWHDARMKEQAGMDDPPTSNLPLRGGKASLYEGGTREPLLVVWPGRTRPGATTDALVQSTDFYPTLLDIAGVPVKAGRKLDGVSFAPVLTGGAAQRTKLFCHFPYLTVNKADNKSPGSYVRQGDWKLIRRYFGNSDCTDRFELFDLRTDIGETKDLAASHPEKVKELSWLLDEYLKDTHAVLPKRNPAYVRADRWAAGRDAKFEVRDQIGTVSNTRDRPTLDLLEAPKVKGSLVLEFRMRAAAGRGGLVLWSTEKDPNFEPIRRQAFEPKCDGRWHEYAVPFDSADVLRGLRIDGSMTPAKLEFAWIRLCEKGGAVLQEWDFATEEK